MNTLIHLSKQIQFVEINNNKKKLRFLKIRINIVTIIVGSFFDNIFKNL